MATTPNFGWTLASVGGDNNAWGTILNTLFNAIDADLQEVLDVADEALTAADALDDAGVLDPISKTLYISYAGFQPAADEDDTTYGVSGAYLTTDNSGNPDIFCPIVLPPGATITQVDVLVDKNGNTSVTARLNKVPFATGVKAEVGTGSTSASGLQSASIAGLSEVVGPNFYTVEVEFSGLGVTGIKVYGVKVTYTSHDLSEVM
jgi:hypothetical protein